MLIVGHVFPDAKASKAPTSYTLTAVLPALAIYLLYHPVLELAMRGRTPGKRIAGVRLVTTSGATPSTGAILIRNLFRLVNALPAFYIVGLICTLVTAKRVRIGDLAAGTILVHDRGDSLAALVALGSLAGQTRLDTAALEIARDLLERWNSLEESHRAMVARALLKRVEPGASALAIEMMGLAALRARIETLLRGESA